MKFWFDTEFIEDGHTIDLISIGIVSEDNREYYAESLECDLSKANDWMKANVIPKLHGNAIPRARIAFEILQFVGKKPEFWAYYASYDWVVLCQLYGLMVHLPSSWPRWCRDIKQLCVSVGDPKLQKLNGEHDALVDARWNKKVWDDLTLMEKSPL